MQSQMLTRQLIPPARIAAFAASLAIGLQPVTAAAANGDRSIPYSTPPDITLINVVKVFPSTSDQYVWRRLGDANGKPLYTYDSDTKPNESSCDGDCAKEFPPLIADQRAVAFGEWTFVKRDSGKTRQWAYQGRPLYRYSGQDPPGEPLADDTSLLGAEDPAYHDPASKLYSPKAGWRRAAYTPEKSVLAPPGSELRNLEVVSGFGFVDAASGMTIYAVPASRKKMPAVWAPVYAPALGQTLGDFSILGRDDGTRQWAYKGKRLYTYKPDYAPGDVYGIFADQGAQVALALRNFSPDSIVIKVLPVRGPAMMTAQGLSVYTQARYNLQYGGRETRTGYSIPYNLAKAVGTRGCTGACTDTWKPVRAPADAHSRGFWEVATRSDGSKQWAYKGGPLYTYAGDTKPGDIGGNNRHVIVYGDPAGKIDLDITVGDVSGRGASVESGSGFYWHLASLYK
jgi:predicted lipoprotein with Yx(FWY)xxD motif